MYGVLLMLCLTAVAAVALATSGGPMAIAAIAGVAVLVWATRRPVYLAGLTIVSDHFSFRFANIMGFIVTPVKIIYPIFALVVILNAVRERKIQPVPKTLFIGFLLLATLRFMSELLSPYGADLSWVQEFGSTVLLMIALSQVIRSPEDLYRVFIVQAIAMVAISLYVVNEVPWSAMLIGRGDVRAYGPTGQPNELASVAAAYFPIALILFYYKGGELSIRVMAAIAAAGALYCQFAAASRGGTVGLIVGLFVIVCIGTRSWSSRLAAVTAGSVALVMIIAVAPDSFERRVIAAVDPSASSEQRSDPLSGRPELIKFGLKLLPERPWLGHGSAGFKYRRSFHEPGMHISLHSAPLRVAVASGIPAGLLYVALGIGALLAAWKSRQLLRNDYLLPSALVGSITASMIMSSASTEVFAPSQWAQISLAYFIHKVASSRPASEPDSVPVRAEAEQTALS